MEWYRTTGWNARDREDFETRLRRTRQHNRPQYLRIKAHSLAAVGLRAEAESLLRRLLEEYPDAFDAPSAIETLGDLAAEDGRLQEAVGWYRRLIREQPDLNTTTGAAHISLAGALLGLGRPEEAVRALGGVDQSALTMNSAVFRYRATLAEAAAAVGDRHTATEAARQALALVDAPDQFSRHPGVGRARAAATQIERLRTLAGGGDGPPA